MARETRRIEVRGAADDVFAFVADFSTTAEWDPGIAEARRLDDGAIGTGSRFAVVSRFGGRRIPITYTITANEPPRRVVPEGVGERFRGVDDIRFSPAGEGRTTIDYEADLRLRGVARIAEPFMRRRFARIATTGCAGSSERSKGEHGTAHERGEQVSSAGPLVPGEPGFDHPGP